ncbi:hypothetical protein HN789_06425 [archaeon]|jgi:hypothetical protein|nr:hypothetical protein [archaeon]MBT4022801.1 hypothetical protein [archaeon]MBT4273005.1 hypothetical protein [archaeon]MBT4460904.1 hypothetical protein [archaeon]MBT4858120.1 hypothetical protein [archaeon]
MEEKTIEEKIFGIVTHQIRETPEFAELEIFLHTIYSLPASPVLSWEMDNPERIYLAYVTLGQDETYIVQDEHQGHFRTIEYKLGEEMRGSYNPIIIDREIPYGG